MTTPPLPKKKPAVFHHPLGFELYDGMSMDLHAMTYAEPLLKENEKLRAALLMYVEAGFGASTDVVKQAAAYDSAIEVLK